MFGMVRSLMISGNAEVGAQGSVELNSLEAGQVSYYEFTLAFKI
jgi:hypothetical protein